MKRYGWVLSAALVAAMAFSTALAGDEEKPKRRKREGAAKREGRKRRERGRRGAGRSMLAQLEQACKLTDEQKAKVEPLVQKYEEARKAAAKESGALRKEMAEARQNKDKDKMKELGQKRRELQEPVRAAMAEVLGALTDDQRAAWDAYQLKQQVLRYFAKANLTDEQKAKVEDLCKKKAAELKGADERSKRGAAMGICKEVYGTLDDTQKANVKEPKERRGRREKPAGGRRKGGRKKKGGAEE